MDSESKPGGGTGVTSSDDTDAVAATGAGAAGSKDQERRGGLFGVVREGVIIVGSALILSLLIKTFLVQAFFIPSESMEATLVKGDRVMVSRMVPGQFDVHRGDIVVFKDPGGWLPPAPPDTRPQVVRAGTALMTYIGLLPQDSGEHLIKRTIGVPGDHVTCCDAQGRVAVNGVSINETYIKPGSIPSQDPFDVTVPADMLFVMGDNRQNSDDSRYNTSKPGGGFVPMENVVGTAFIKVWPLSHAGLLRNPGSVFKDVPEP